MLTLRQKQIRDFVTKIIKRKDIAPSEREVASHFRISASTAHEHMEMLKEKGYLQKTPRRARAIGLREPDNEKLVLIPLLGRIAAGLPIEVIRDKKMIAIPQSRLPFPAGDCYTLEVAGDSMIDEDINDGDVVLIKAQKTAENGQKVVALINNSEATLKTFYKEKSHIRLQPANKNYEPIIVDKGTPIEIQGIVVEVIRDSGNTLMQPLNLPSKETEHQIDKISDYLNKVYNGDVMHILKNLPDDSVDMIFGDPDYNVGIKYGNNNYTRNFDDYINWYIELTKESMRVLKKDGNLFMLNYPKQNAHLRVRYLDLHFPYVNDYVWVYNTNVGHTPKRFTTAHRSILHVRKSADNKFFKDEVALPYKNPTDKRIQQNLANGSKGRMPYSWFEFNLVKNVSKEKTEHACQIPQKLTELLIKACTKEGDIVFPLFGGSGAEIEIAWRLKRRFLTAELNPRYCEIIEDRLKKGYIDGEYRLGPHGKKKVMGLSSAY